MRKSDVTRSPNRRRSLLGATCVAMGVLLSAGGQALANPAVSQEMLGQYRLGHGDKVRIQVYNEPSLSGEFSISDSGEIALPLIGATKAGDKTITELRNAITAALADGYVNHPQVTVEVTTYRPFYILGEVTKPGEYPYSSGLTVLEAVATANGFTYRANSKTIALKHEGEVAEHEEPLTPSTLVQPGDTVRIKERFF